MKLKAELFDTGELREFELGDVMATFKYDDSIYVSDSKGLTSYITYRLSTVRSVEEDKLRADAYKLEKNIDLLETIVNRLTHQIALYVRLS